MKQLLGVLLICLFCVQGFAQSTRKIRELEKQHAELQNRFLHPKRCCNRPKRM